MNEEQRLRISYSRLLGEYIGTVSGVIENDIPDDLLDKLNGVLADLREQEKELDNVHKKCG